MGGKYQVKSINDPGEIFSMMIDLYFYWLRGESEALFWIDDSEPWETLGLSVLVFEKKREEKTENKAYLEGFVGRKQYR